MNNWIQSLPKTELHLHIEGTLEPELLVTLAQRNHIPLPYQNAVEARAAYQFSNLQSFLNSYYLGMSVLIQQQDFYDLTWNYLQKCHQQNIRHVEIFFDAQVHIHRGVAFATVILGIHQALQDAKIKWQISSHLILCFLRDLSAEDALNTLKMALPYQDKFIGVGLDSAELGNPPAKFQAVFDLARANGLITVAHAGEEGPAEYIWQAIQLLKVSRIDHGFRCLEDNHLVNYIVEHQIPLTLCPISNIKLKAFPTLSDHPLKVLLEQGICITINSDDPAYFNAYLAENYLDTATALNLSKNDLKQIAINGFKASLLDDSEKKLYIEEINQK